MPTYEYECKNCGHEMEAFQSMTEERLKTCPQCKKDTLHRLIGVGAGIIFKGTGWYCTDFKNNDKPAPATTSEKSTSTTSNNSGPKSETKVETKSDTKSSTKSETQAGKK